MSWFVLKDQPSRSKRIGIWLRIHTSSNEDVRKLIKKTKFMRLTDTIQRVLIHELRKDDKVLLQVWCKSLVDCIMGKNRSNVFYVLTDENPEWVCEGDLGRGLEK